MKVKIEQLIGMLLAPILFLGMLIGCGEDHGPSPPVFLLNVDAVTVEVSTQYQLFATADGETTEALWYVEEVRGGTPSYGMITSDGLFIAPLQKPKHAGSVRVTAKWSRDTTLTASAFLIIHEPEGAISVRVDPDSVKIEPGESIEFNASFQNCDAEDVNWSVAKAYGLDPIGEIGEDGTYTAPSSASLLKLVVMAKSSNCPNKIGIALLEVVSPVTPFIVELEGYSDFSNMGGQAINRIQCSAASGGKSVAGLDYPGDQISVPFRIEKSGSYRVSVRYASGEGDIISVRVTIKGCGQEQYEDYSLTEGTGTG
ncbi:MAG: hypothetical protein ACUVUU_07415 [bacterium]